MKNVMISYNRNDYAYISKLRELLKKENIDPWIDQVDIPQGHPWRPSIYKAVISSEFIIICLSPSYIESEICRMETYLARCYKKKVLPIMIEDCWELMNKYNAFKGMGGLYVIDMFKYNSFGLLVSEKTQVFNLINTIKNNYPDWSTIDAYVSYKASKAAYATQIADDLNSMGLRTWIATRSYQIGQTWLELQWDALMRTPALIIILSEEIAESSYIKDEILIALTREIPILPVLINDDKLNEVMTRELSKSLDRNHEMRSLSEINWFYPNRPDYKTMIQELYKAIKR